MHRTLIEDYLDTRMLALESARKTLRELFEQLTDDDLRKIVVESAIEDAKQIATAVLDDRKNRSA